ncbi:HYDROXYPROLINE-RICH GLYCOPROTEIN FAMILY PROTEIN [Salix purpurea]|uniref:HYDROXYPROLINE-RICH GLYCOPROTEIN FAMILY PROTEIN n=1 Tax=Salix purpurea TaxID=77065 RepID=A0A9Q0ZW72_SALPP|nr:HYDROXYPROLINE-RICH GLYCOPROTEIN FAMILY PROTEIN [Salix purpurea]
MTGKPIAGEGLPANLAGMTKNQLYDIMFQMKTLIEQNKQQAKEILIQNPLLTKALFQAQIMLGMVQPPQVVPNIQPAASQQPQQSAQPSRQSNIQAAQTLPGQDAVQDKTSISQSQPPMKKQHQSQPAMSISAPPVPPVNLQSQPLPSHPLHMPQQPKGHLNPQVTSMSVTQSSQLPNLPPASSHSVSQPLPIHQTQMSSVSSQLQLPLQTPEIPHLPLQPPFQPQSRTPSVPSFHHQYGQQMGPNMGYQHAGAPHHPSQPMFHSSNKPHSSMGPSYPQGQPPHPNHQPPQSYQAGGSHLGGEYNSQIATSMQVDRGSSWMSGPPNSSMTQLAGPPQFNPGQMAQGNQSSRTAPMSSEMEKALLQQVMSLTPEQINLLPPEQRNQFIDVDRLRSNTEADTGYAFETNLNEA